MENDINEMEHWDEDEDHVLITMENNPNRKAKKGKIQKMLIEVMTIHEALAKNFIEFNFFWKGNITFLNTSNYGLECDEWFIGSHLM